MEKLGTTGLNGRALTVLTGLLITVFPFISKLQAQQGCVFACPPMNPPTQVSVSSLCQDTLTYDELGVIPSAECTGDILIDLLDNGVSIGNVITIGMAGNTYMVIATNPESGQSCMFTILIVDKQLPLVVCPDDVILDCTADLGAYTGLTPDDVSDCSPTTITFDDVLISSGNCVGDIVSQYLRTYVVADAYNNAVTCEQVISLAKVSLDDVDFPVDHTGGNALACFPPPDLSPDATGYPSVNGTPILNGMFCNLSAIYSDLEVPLCSGSYKIIRTWTVIDWCEGNSSAVGVQTIEVLDTTGPVVTAPADITVSTASTSCSASVVLPPALIEEDCSDIWTVRMQGPFGTIHSNGGIINGLPVGVHQVTYIATNDCIYSGQDVIFVTVLDLQPPAPVCHHHIAIPVNNTGISIVPAHVFDAGSTDNCADVYFKVRRMNAPQGYTCANPGNPGNLFDDYIQFCCEDIINNRIMVILRVFDVPVVAGPVADDYLAGHFNECMIEVEVQDKLPPQIICPSHLTVSCEFPYAVENLEVFGSIALSEQDREQICIDDPGAPGNPGLQCTGLDGLATDNCGVVVTELAPLIEINTCGYGTITRTFSATDDGGLTVTCQQTITIVNYEPFGPDDIAWPPDYTTFDICEVDLLAPQYLPPPFNQPALNDGPCDLTGFSYEDDVFDFSNSDQACFKILRTWKVIDWCQVNGSQGGVWTYMQTIKVMNTVPPEIGSLTNVTTCSFDPDCEGLTLDFSASASDDCSGPASLTWRYFIDLDNDQDFDYISPAQTGQSVAFSTFIPIGDHRILYSVTDKCGNTDTGEQLVSVESCVLPSPVCHHGLSTALMPVDTDGDGNADWGMVTIFADMFDAGSYHPCGNAISVSFSPDPQDITRVFDCNHIGTNAVDLWVIDENGLTDFCSTTLEITDNHDICPPSQGGLTGTISGSITVPQSGSLSNAIVHLEGSNLSGIPTGDNGRFIFPAMPFGGSYQVRPERNGDDKNGVSVLDLVKIQKHLLGIGSFTSPFDLIAADASNNGSITALDIIQLRRLILGIDTKLQHNASWRFVDKSYIFTDPANPWTSAWPETYTIIPFMSSMHDVDFHAIKIGDLDHSASLQFNHPLILPREGKMAQIVYVIGAESEKNLYRVDLYLDEAQAYEAVQASFSWDHHSFRMIGWMPGDLFTPDEFRMPEHEGENISVAVFAPGGWTNGNARLMTMWMEPVTPQAGSFRLFLNPEPTAPVAYTLAHSDPAAVQLVAGKTNHVVETENRPNPFRDMTTIYVRSLLEENAVLRVYDMNGRARLSRQVALVQGQNEFVVRKTELGAAGVFVYEIESNQQYSTNRMIIIE